MTADDKPTPTPLDSIEFEELWKTLISFGIDFEKEVDKLRIKRRAEKHSGFTWSDSAVTKIRNCEKELLDYLEGETIRFTRNRESDTVTDADVRDARRHMLVRPKITKKRYILHAIAKLFVFLGGIGLGIGIVQGSYYLSGFGILVAIASAIIELYITYQRI